MAATSDTPFSVNNAGDIMINRNLSAWKHVQLWDKRVWPVVVEAFDTGNFIAQNFVITPVNPILLNRSANLKMFSLKCLKRLESVCTKIHRICFGMILNTDPNLRLNLAKFRPKLLKKVRKSSYKRR